MKKCYLSTKLVTLTINLLLITLFAAQATAVKKPRQSNLNGGWQIWIAAVDFDRLGDNRFVKRGKEAGKEGPKPVLAEDVLIGISNRHRVLRAKGAPEYDFTSPHAGDAYIYARVMGLANNRAWFVDLNPAAGDVAYSIITPLQWKWATDDRAALGKAFVRPKLIQGLNTIRILPRDSPPPGNDVLMDIFVVLTVAFKPADQQYKRAKVALHLAVEPADKLATTWGRIKQAF